MTGLLASKGRANDSLLAHISPREAMILKMMGGSGTKNPKTGLLEFAEDPYEPYIKNAMQTAQNILAASRLSAYPSYVPQQANAPSRVSYFDYTPSAPMSQIQAPNYKMTAGDTKPWQGLMGGDYNALQTALTTPGANAAQGAYQQGQQNLTNAMGGRGLYGSSIMQNQQTQGLDKVYQQALADNAAKAAATRYGMQSEDLARQNAYNQAARAQDLTREQAMNQYQTTETAGLRGQAYDTARIGQAEAAQQNLYNQGRQQTEQTWQNLMTDWQNKQNYERNFLYPQAQQAFNQAQQEMIMNRALALAGAGAPLSGGANLYNAYQNASNAANTNAWLQLAGGIGGGLLSNWGSIFGNVPIK